MRDFIHFCQIKGGMGCLLHVGIGILMTVGLTLIGYLCSWIGLFGDWSVRLFFWQSILLTDLFAPNVVVEGHSYVPGIPYMILWVIGILSGVPLYTFLSYLVFYLVRRDRSEES